jgi:hypothetical protein
MNGQITDYNPYNKRGIISGPDGEHAFGASAELAGEFSNTIIPPDAPVDVTYDVAGTGEAINVCLAQTVNLAASADPMPIRNFAARKTPTAPAKKASKKKAPRIPAKKAMKKSGRKKTAAKKSPARKSQARKLSSKTAPKKRRP